MADPFVAEIRIFCLILRRAAGHFVMDKSCRFPKILLCSHYWAQRMVGMDIHISPYRIYRIYTNASRARSRIILT